MSHSNILYHFATQEKVKKMREKVKNRWGKICAQYTEKILKMVRKPLGTHALLEPLILAIKSVVARKQERAMRDETILTYDEKFLLYSKQNRLILIPKNPQTKMDHLKKSRDSARGEIPYRWKKAQPKTGDNWVQTQLCLMLLANNKIHIECTGLD